MDDQQSRNAQASYDILERLLPEFRSLFEKKNKDYAGAFFFLGIKGQFSDINRKFWKLKNALWDDQELTGEQAREILLDLIGHCFLTIHLLDSEAGAGEGPTLSQMPERTRSMLTGEAPQKRCEHFHAHDQHLWAHESPSGASLVMYCPGRQA